MIWIIYLIGIVDGAKCMLVIPTIITIIGLFIMYVVLRIDCYDYDNDDVEKLHKKVNKQTKQIFLLLIPLTIGLLIPSSKTISAMYLIPKITTNEQVQQIPDKVLKVMNGKLDEWIEDLTKERKDK